MCQFGSCSRAAGKLPERSQRCRLTNAQMSGDLQAHHGKQGCISQPADMDIGSDDWSAWDERKKAYQKYPIPEEQWLVRNTALPLKETPLKLLGVLANTPDVCADLT